MDDVDDAVEDVSSRVLSCPSSFQFRSLRTLSLSCRDSASLNDAVVRDVLAPHLLSLVELFLPSNVGLVAACCVSVPHWPVLERLSLHNCANLTALWSDATAVPVRLLHVDVTDCRSLLGVPSLIARTIAARGGTFGVECDAPQAIFEGDATDRGSVSISTNALTFERLHLFDAVLSLCGDDDLPRDAFVAWSGQEHLHVDVEDTDETLLPLDATTRFLQRHSGKRRLVHCVVGASRSAAAIAAWLVGDRKFTLEQALTELRAVRPICQPNAGFLRQLADFTLAPPPPTTLLPPQLAQLPSRH
jgi:predicted protein tyrosine phosphatase